MAERDWERAGHVLCVRLDTIGDVLLTTPALRALKASRTGRRLTLLTSTAGAQVAPLVPEVDRTLVYDAPWIKATPPRADSSVDQAMIDRLRQEGFDAAAIFTVYSQNPLPAAMTCYLAGVPLRLAHCHENPYQLLTDWVRDPEPAEGVRHEVLRHLDLVATVGAHTDDDTLSLHAPDDAYTQALRALDEAGVDLLSPWVVLHSGATAPSRRYPAGHFAEVARRLSREHDFQVVFTGTGAERGQVEAIREAAGAPSYSLVGQLDLAGLAALIALAPLLISNNTGPVHIAAALGTPVVDLYALTNPQHTPWRVPHRVLSHDVDCKYCYKSVCPAGHHACLRGVAPEAVVQAALDLLHEVAENGQRVLEAGE